MFGKRKKDERLSTDDHAKQQDEMARRYTPQETLLRQEQEELAFRLFNIP